MLLAETKARTIQNVLSIDASRYAKAKRRMRREVSPTNSAARAF